MTNIIKHGCKNGKILKYKSKKLLQNKFETIKNSGLNNLI